MVVAPEPARYSPLPHLGCGVQDPPEVGVAPVRYTGFGQQRMAPAPPDAHLSPMVAHDSPLAPIGWALGNPGHLQKPPQSFGVLAQSRGLLPCLLCTLTAPKHVTQGAHVPLLDALAPVRYVEPVHTTQGLHCIVLLVCWPSGQVVQVVSSLVFSVLAPAVNFSVVPHVVLFGVQAVAALVLPLNCPSAQPVHLVSSDIFWLLSPTVKYCAAGHVVDFTVHAVSLLLYLPSAQSVHAVSSRVLSLLDPARNVWPLPHDARLALHAVLLVL